MEGNPDELAGQYVDIRAANPKMNVVGGRSGTDYVHVEKNWASAAGNWRVRFERKRRV